LYKGLRLACSRFGIRFEGCHLTRHTMITWARRGGAQRDVVERLTHNAAGVIIDQYTHFDWEPLCQAVSCIDYRSPAASPTGQSPAGQSPAANSAAPAAPAALPGATSFRARNRVDRSGFHGRFHGRSTKTIKNIGKFSGGAGNRTRVRKLSN